MCRRNSPQKGKCSIGCVRETPQVKVKLARNV